MIDVGFPSYGNYRVSVRYGWIVTTAIAVTSATNFSIDINTDPYSALRGEAVAPVELITEAGDLIAAESGSIIIMG